MSLVVQKAPGHSIKMIYLVNITCMKCLELHHCCYYNNILKEIKIHFRIKKNSLLQLTIKPKC